MQWFIEIDTHSPVMFGVDREAALVPQGEAAPKANEHSRVHSPLLVLMLPGKIDVQ